MTPNDPYTGRTAPLTSKRCILYIYSTNIRTEYFKPVIYSVFFSLQNSVCFIIITFGSCIHIIYTGCAKIKKYNSVAKRLNTSLGWPNIWFGRVDKEKHHFSRQALETRILQPINSLPAIPITSPCLCHKMGKWCKYYCICYVLRTTTFHLKLMQPMTARKLLNWLVRLFSRAEVRDGRREPFDGLYMAEFISH